MIEKTFVASDSSFEEAMAFVEDQLGETGISMKITMQVMVAFEEMYVNVCHYAYPDTEGTVLVRIDTSGGVLYITLEDSGVPFNPLERKAPDITLSAEERKIGGLGIFMVRKTMTDLKYEYKDGRNILTMIKNYE